MATIEELERLEAQQRHAEAKALRDLAGYLREAVIDLPAHSPMARAFAKFAREFEQWSGHYRDCAVVASNQLHELSRGIRSDHGVTTPLDRAAEAVREAAEWAEETDDDWAGTLRRLARTMDRRS
jgi:hypothetical protein